MKKIVIHRKLNGLLCQVSIYIYLINALCKYFFPSSITKILPIFSVVLLLISLSGKLKINFCFLDIPFIVFLIVWFVGCIYSPSMLKGFGYVFSFFIGLFLSLLISKHEINEDKIFYLVSIICIIFSAFIILQPLLPDFVINIAKIFKYDGDSYLLMVAWMRNGWYSGLFPDRAPAAFFCSLLIGCGLYFLYQIENLSTNKYRFIFSLFSIFIGIYGIMLTAKRGLLIGVAVSSLFTYIIYKKAKKQSILKICLSVGLLIVIIGIIVLNLDVSQIMIERFLDNDNVMTYRDVIYENIFHCFWQNPIFGTGTASAFKLLGIGGHNIYLTVLMENGIVGIISFMFMCLITLVFTIKSILRYGYEIDNKTPSILLFSLYMQLFFLIYGMSGNPLYDNYILYFYLFSFLLLKNKRLNIEKGRCNNESKYSNISFSE